MNFERAIVVGGTSGIGHAIVEHLRAAGTSVAVVGRSASGAQSYAHDVTETHDVAELFQKITLDLGGLDLFIYASGVMPEVGIEEFNTEKDLEIMRVNVLGAIAWINEAATRFQGTRSGTILGIGSVAGDRGRAGQPAYNASKAALATYLEAVRNRLDKLGVTVVTVKPGPVQTPMTQHLTLPKAITANQAAIKILKLAHKPGEHYLSPVHRIIFAVIRMVPGFVFRRYGPP